MQLLQHNCLCLKIRWAKTYLSLTKVPSPLFLYWKRKFGCCDLSHALLTCKFSRNLGSSLVCSVENMKVRVLYKLVKGLN